MKRFFLGYLMILASLLGARGQSVQDYAPLRLAEFVADKVVDNTRFEYGYALQPTYPDIEAIDFGRSCDDRLPGIAYALSTMNSEMAQEQEFEVGRTGPIKIWLNDELVFSRTDIADFKVVFDEKTYFLPEKFTVRLRKGENKILVKSAYAGKGEWQFLLQGHNMSRYAEKGQRIKCSLEHYAPKVTGANWLVLGTFNGGIDTVYEPESAIELYKLYPAPEGKITWNIPRINLLIENPNGGKFYDWSYHVGCFVWGLQRLSQVSGKDKYADYAARWCEFVLNTKPLVEYQTKKLNAVRSMNFGQAGRPMLDYTSAPSMPFMTRLVYENDFPARERYRIYADSILQYLRHDQFRVNGIFARTYTVYPSVWADDMYMGIPYLVYAARATDDKVLRKELLDDAANQVVTFSELLQDRTTGLYMQACYPSKPGVKVPFWSRGNGWALWATSEVLMALPKEHKLYKQLLYQFRTQVDALLRYQDSDGYWRNVLDMEESVRESSGTAIFTLCIARGINNGWLSRTAYSAPLEKAWGALKTFVDENGDFNGVKGGTNFSTDPMDYERGGLIKSDTHGLLPLVFACIEMDGYFRGK